MGGSVWSVGEGRQQGWWENPKTFGEEEHVLLDRRRSSGEGARDNSDDLQGANSSHGSRRVFFPPVHSIFQYVWTDSRYCILLVTTYGADLSGVHLFGWFQPPTRSLPPKVHWTVECTWRYSVVNPTLSPKRPLEVNARSKASIPRAACFCTRAASSG